MYLSLVNSTRYVGPAGHAIELAARDAALLAYLASFANALPSWIQSYVPPAGVEPAHHVDLGFTGAGSYYADSAYDLGADPTFQQIAHSASTAAFTFVIEGQGVQNLNDESWAMDHLSVRNDRVNAPVPEPQT